MRPKGMNKKTTDFSKPFGNNYGDKDPHPNDKQLGSDNTSYPVYLNGGFEIDLPRPENASVNSREELAIENDAGKTPAGRDSWGGKAEFILSCLGYAVGLGSLWRFPYMVYDNGGGAFLLPYLLMLFVLGLPVFFMEMILGQYSASGPMHVWSISPLFYGIGFGMEIITFLSSLSYNMVMGWSFYYLFASWSSTVPWSDCSHPYNTANCYTIEEAKECEKGNVKSGQENAGSWWFNHTCFTSINCKDDPIACNRSYVEASRISASQEYFENRVLNLSPSIDDSGSLQWELVLVLLLAWIVCWLCTVKGIKSAGKVVYFTALFPFVIILILLVRGSLLEGAYNGVFFYINPQWDKLTTAKVWVQAMGQGFYSLGVGTGSLMTFSSYNKFNNNIYRDVWVVVLVDAVFSILAGFTIFTIIGHMAFKLDKDVADVITAGPGLAFVAYPEVFTYFPLPQLWSSLFFFMLVLLGVDSQMAYIETMLTAIVDCYPFLRRWKPLVAGCICFVMFLLGLTMCLRSGLYWLDLISTYTYIWSLVLIATLEIVVITWIYGARRLMKDLEMMTGVKLWHHWWVLFKIITPILVLVIFIFSFIDYKPMVYANKKPYPQWSQVLGWMMAWVSIAVVPLVAVYIVFKSYSDPEYAGLSFGRRLVALARPSSKWMPGPEKVRLEAEMKNQNGCQTDYF